MSCYLLVREREIKGDILRDLAALRKVSDRNQEFLTDSNVLGASLSVSVHK